jgi:hypothetical protein
VEAVTVFDQPREIESLRQAFRAAADTSRGRDEGPVTEFDAETVYRAVAGELPETETRRLIDALATDPTLAETWALARDLVDAERRLHGAATVTPLRRKEPALRSGWAAIAAVLALAVGVGVWRQMHPTPVWRGGGSEVAAAVAETADGASLPRAAVVLRFRVTDPDVREFELTVVTLDLTPVHRQRDPIEPGPAKGDQGAREMRREVRLAEDLFTDFPRGTRFLWRLTTITGDGRTTRTAPSTFVLAD